MDPNINLRRRSARHLMNPYINLKEGEGRPGDLVDPYINLKGGSKRRRNLIGPYINWKEGQGDHETSRIRTPSSQPGTADRCAGIRPPRSGNPIVEWDLPTPKPKPKNPQTKKTPDITQKQKGEQTNEKRTKDWNEEETTRERTSIGCEILFWGGGPVWQTRDPLFSNSLFSYFILSSLLLSSFISTVFFPPLFCSLLLLSLPCIPFSSFLRFVSGVCSINGLFDLLRWLIWPCLIVLFLMCDFPFLFF